MHHKKPINIENIKLPHPFPGVSVKHGNPDV